VDDDWPFGTAVTRPVMPDADARIVGMTTETPRMPTGVRLFLGYAFLILAGIALSLSRVVDQAIDQPISPLGIIWMGLLAYTIFTITLTLQRKEAARSLALGLASLTIPAVPLLVLGAFLPGAIVVAAVAVGLFRGLTRPTVRAYLSEP
jgi:hypothetical protein